MPTRTPLRAVTDSDKPARVLSILDAAEAGSRIEELRAMRRRIARAMDDVTTPARDLAALSRRQLEIGKEIEAIVVSEDEDHSVVVNADDEVWDGTSY